MFDLDSLDLSKLTKEEIIEGAKSIVKHVNERILDAQGEVDNALDILSMMTRKAGGVVVLSEADQTLPAGQLIVSGNKFDGSVTLTFAVKLIVPEADATGVPAEVVYTGPKLVLPEQSE